MPFTSLGSVVNLPPDGEVEVSNFLPSFFTNEGFVVGAPLCMVGCEGPALFGGAVVLAGTFEGG